MSGKGHRDKTGGDRHQRNAQSDCGGSSSSLPAVPGHHFDSCTSAVACSCQGECLQYDAQEPCRELMMGWQ